jgi:glutathione S-transferase
MALMAGDGPTAIEKLRLGIAFDDADDAFLPDDLGQRSPADAWHTEHVCEWIEEGLSPEEWVARNSDYLIADNSDRFRYADPALDDWVHRVFAILRSLPLRDLAKERHLTPEERARIETDAEATLDWP